jgi:hypothetical protein
VREIEMAVKRIVPGVRSYTHPAGGWGALRATAKAVREQMDIVEAPTSPMASIVPAALGPTRSTPRHSSSARTAPRQ